VVLLDGIEFLVDSNNFNSVLRFLRRTVDMVSQMEQILLVSVGPDTLQQRELRNLEREMDVLRLA
jgi:archaellum biogenesis ATPase FlaH